jgi:uncharacterized protein YlbG (UPF0298 family)
MFENRQGMIVYLHSTKNARALRKYGNIHYVSKKMKYVVLYCAMENIQELQEKVNQLPFVKDVKLSYKPFIRTEYDSASREKEKEYDYNFGI